MAQKFRFNPFTGTLDLIDVAAVATDELVKVSANDTTAGVLNGKLTAGTNITLTENNDGVNEDLEVSAPNLANDTLSNLSSPTAVNQDLIPSGSRSLGNSTDPWNGLDVIDTTGVQWITGAGTTQFEILTVGGTDINFNGINTTASLDINIKTGNASAGDSGDMTFTIGTASGTQGDFKFLKSGVASVSGQVWTASSTDGTGYWANPSGANTSLSNLTSPTDINQNLRPNGDLNRRLGEGGREWLEVVSPTFTSAQSGRDIILKSATVSSPSSDTGKVTVSSGAHTGTSGSQPSGNVEILSGTLTNAGSSGDSGDIIIKPGTVAGAGSRGKITFQDGSEGTGGQIWTSSNTTGQGSWSAFPTDIARWQKFTVSHTALQAATTTNDIELFSLSTKEFIHEVVIKHATAFAGTGITAYTISIGITGTLDKYASAFDVFQATGDTTFQVSNSTNMENFSSATSIRIAATSTSANLDQSTTGLVDIWVRTSTLV